MSTFSRHRGPIAVAAGLCVLTAVAFPAYTSWVTGLHDDGASAEAASAGPVEPAPHEHAPSVGAPGGGAAGDGHDHDHTDPATKNLVSRSVETAADVAEADPTTPAEAAAAEQAVTAQRAEPDPELVPAAAPAPRRTVPEDRYAMAGGCYALQSTTTGGWVVRDGDRYRASGARADAEPFHLQATDLGRYLLWDTRERFLARGLTSAAVAAPRPSARADWTVEQVRDGFRLSLRDGRVVLGARTDDRVVTGRTQAAFALRLVDGCADWEEAEINVEGAPHAGASPVQEVRGYTDAHTHGMAFEFLGGQVHCGRPWHPYGVRYALRDCPDHHVADGSGALLENLLKGGSVVQQHDPVGWPTFRDWPAPDSLTHEGTYYRWMERAWRGGLRVFVNLLVENNQLCMVYPLKRNSCDDMDSIRLQADDMRAFERYVDAQAGGPGEGWYRIVTDPFEARRVVNAGKLAVVMGIETSVLFGCSSKLDVPTCSKASIDRQLAEVHDLGVRQMELVNKFDNALAGVAGDEGGAAPVINLANFLETGSFWDMRRCPDGQPGVHDKAQLTASDGSPEQDALFGAIAELHVPLKLPVYAGAPHCNARGLTGLGAYTVERMIDEQMLFDPDHMSVAARAAALDVTERRGYSGVLSSHSWSTPDAYPRIYEAGGFVAPYAGDSTGFVEKWRQHVRWADPRYYFGFGFGADINGLGAQGSPRGEDAEDAVAYPFTGLGGVRVDRQVSGERVYDLNVDGVAHYGLYPDWIEDLRRLAGDDVVADMERGAEAYLQTWERAVGVPNDACRDPRALQDASVLTGLRRGTSVERLLRTAGQPHERLGTTFGYCVRDRSGASVRLRAELDDAGRLVRVRRG